MMYKLAALILPALLTGAGAVAQTANPPKRPVVEGKVVNSITGAPIRKVELTLTTSLGDDVDVQAIMAQFGASADVPDAAKPAKDKKSFAATTDAAGKFHIDADPGDYYLSAKHAGFVPEHYKPEGKYNVEGKIHLQAADSLSDLAMRMVPFASIAGRVVDEDGDPVPNAMVVAHTQNYSTGKRKLMPADEGQTNGKGEFQLDKLPPGRYSISATVMGMDPMGVDPPAPADGSPETGYVTTFYPDVTDSSLGTTVDVAAAAELSGYKLQLRKSRVARIKAQALAEDGTPLKSGQIMLMSPLNPASMKMKMLNNPEGRFEMTGVQPGAHTLMIMQMGGTNPSMRMFPIVVPSEGLKDVKVGTRSEARVQGHVTGKIPKGLTMMLSSEDAPEMPAVTTVSESGDFTLTKVAAIPYQLSLEGLTGAYLKSVQWNGHEKLGGELDFSGGVDGTLEVTLGADGGQYQATVTQSDKPVAGATVVLIPADEASRNPETTSSGETDGAGHVVLKDLRPGRYMAFAWERVDQGDWFDPAFIKKYLGQGVAVTIQPNGQEKSDLKLIPGK